MSDISPQPPLPSKSFRKLASLTGQTFDLSGPVLENIEAAIRAMITGSAPDRHMLRHVLSRGDCGIAALMIEHHGAAVFREIQASPDRAVNSTEIFLSGRTDILDLLISHGIAPCNLSETEDIIISPTTLLHALQRKCAGDVLDRVMQDGATRRIILDRHIVDFVRHAGAGRGACLARHLCVPDTDRAWACIEAACADALASRPIHDMDRCDMNLFGVILLSGRAPGENEPAVMSRARGLVTGVGSSGKIPACAGVLGALLDEGAGLDALRKALRDARAPT